MSSESAIDVLVIGAGNAALAAAVSAREQGAGRVVALERPASAGRSPGTNSTTSCASVTIGSAPRIGPP